MNRRAMTAAMMAGFLLFASLTFIQMQGCGGDGSSSSTAALTVGITDSPAFRDFSSVHLKILKVTVVPAGNEDSADNDQANRVIAEFPNGVDVNILKLHFLQQILGTAQVPVGTYNQVRLVLAPNPAAAPFNNYFILSGSSQQVALTTPSGQQSGVKITGKFTVSCGVANTILLDFNPNEAIVLRGQSGQNNLKPTGIRIIQVFSSLENSASISGTIRSPAFKPQSSATFKKWSSAVVSVVPRNPAASAIASTTIFSNFSGLGVWKAPFTAFVPPTGSAAMPSANYKVFVNAGSRFKPFSSALMTAPTIGQDFPVPPKGIVQLAPAP